MYGAPKEVALKTESTAEQLYFTTVYLHGVKIGGLQFTATGFFYKVLTEQGDVDFLITNRHVLQDCTTLILKMIKGGSGDKPILGESLSVTINDFESSPWVGHPNPDVDIAVFPANLYLGPMAQAGSQMFYKTISPKIVLTDDEAENLDAIESIIFVGYPEGIFDAKHHLPLVRRGITASPLSVDFNGIPSFAIDAGVYQGSSGSPVIILDQGWIVDRLGNTSFGNRFKLVGVISENFQRESMGVVQTETATQYAKYKEAIGLGIAVKAKCIDECVDLFLKNVGSIRLENP